MPVVIKTEAEKTAEHETEVQDAEAQAAAEMAAKARETVDNEIDSTPASKEESNEWDALLTDDDDIGSEDNPVSTNEAEVKEEVKGEPAEEEPAAAEETPLAEEAKTDKVTKAEETETPEVVIPPVEEPAAETRTAEEIEIQTKKARDEAQNKLTEQFALSEEDAEELVRNPNAVLPKMAATLFLDLYDSIMQGLQTQMPGMVMHVIKQNEAVQSAEKAFYGAWPQLAKAEYRPTIDRIRQSYFQMNAGADMETAIKEIGAQAWVALKLPIEELVQHTQGARQQQQQQTPATPTNVTHIPAHGGNSSAQETRKPVGEFEELAEEFLFEDAN